MAEPTAEQFDAILAAFEAQREAFEAERAERLAASEQAKRDAERAHNDSIAERRQRWTDPGRWVSILTLVGALVSGVAMFAVARMDIAANGARIKEIESAQTAQALARLTEKVDGMMRELDRLNTELADVRRQRRP